MNTQCTDLGHPSSIVYAVTLIQHGLRRENNTGGLNQMLNLVQTV